MEEQDSNQVASSDSRVILEPVHHVFKCSDCKKKIVVIQIFYGVPHSYIASVLCGECLLSKGIDEGWIEKYPKEYKKLMSELNDTEDEDTEV